ncbi:MAG: cytochrome c [Alphaproteobacteria bacterium]|nr:cytochrome c [Alphaproteobacteria bacterium]
MIRTLQTVAIAIALGVFAAGMAPIAPASAADMASIDKRLELMKKIVLKNFKTVKAFVKEGKGSASDVKMAGEALAAAAPKIPALFPKGTGRPDVDEKKTRALAKIWQDWAGFEAAAKSLGTEATKLAKVAAGGDKGAIGAQFGEMGKKGCGGCHKSFRGAKVK